MSKKPYLSKYEFNSGRQCLKRLWLEANEPGAPELKNKKGMPATYLANQEDVRQIARASYKDAKLIEKGDVDTLVKATQAALEDPAVKAIFNASFLAESVHAQIDIVEKSPKGLKLIKLRTGKSLDEEHVAEAALLRHIVATSGQTVKTVEIVTVNGDSTFPKLDDILVTHNVTKRLDDHSDGLAGTGPKLLEARDAAKAPNVTAGDQCTKPEKCPFQSRCDKAKAATAPKKMKVAKRDLAHALEPLRAGPLAFLDFETVAPAIPFLHGLVPYKEVPVQFSVHVESKEGYAHHEWIATTSDDPRPALAKALIKACRGAKRILTYSAYEGRVMKGLAEALPDLKAELMDIHARIFDLLPVVWDHVEHPDFNGSFSIKAVLPALCPGVSYDKLEVGDGTKASARLKELMTNSSGRSKVDVEKDVNALKEYCKMDTWAMVELLKRLRVLAMKTAS